MTQIALVGEAWGEEEERQRAPFVGASGRFLNLLLSRGGLSRKDCFVTNVFNLRPAGNNMKHLCGDASQSLRGWPVYAKGKYIRAEFAPELTRLREELTALKPNLVIALGNTAAWALLKVNTISRIRGTVMWSDWGFKVLPTYHPAAVLRQYNLHPIVIKDFEKAARESLFPEIRRPDRFVHIEPDLNDLYDFERQYIEPASLLSVDIETFADQITCIGFAPTADRSIVVPFHDPTKADGNYWGSIVEELEVWEWVRKQCLRHVRFVGQNFNYDMKFLYMNYGITFPNGEVDDTMLLHHAMQPEMQKSLGFLASIYTDELSWKFMRPKHDTKKLED